MPRAALRPFFFVRGYVPPQSSWCRWAALTRMERRGRLGLTRWLSAQGEPNSPHEAVCAAHSQKLILSMVVCTAFAAPLVRAQQNGAAPPAPAPPTSGASPAPSSAPAPAQAPAPAPPPGTKAPAPAAGAPAASGPTVSARPAAKPAPAPPATPQAEALQLYRTGKFEEAIGAYTKIAPTDPATAYAGLTRVYLRQKRTDDAYAAINKAVSLAPDAPDVRVALAEVYYRQGKIMDADHELVKVVNSGGRSARAYLDLARVARTASYYARAKKMIEMAYRLDPDDPDVHREWLETLPRAQRAAELKKYLDGETDDDAKDRSALMRQLSVLEEIAGQQHRSCRQVNQVHSTETKLESLMNDARNMHGYGLSVNLNGATAKLELDTGAGGILINRHTAEKAGVKAIVQTRDRRDWQRRGSRRLHRICGHDQNRRAGIQRLHGRGGGQALGSGRRRTDRRRRLPALFGGYRSTECEIQAEPASCGPERDWKKRRRWKQIAREGRAGAIRTSLRK